MLTGIPYPQNELSTIIPFVPHNLSKINVIRCSEGEYLHAT